MASKEFSVYLFYKTMQDALDASLEGFGPAKWKIHISG